MLSVMQPFEVVKATPQHLDGMVRVHIDSFPGEYLALLGPDFLRAFYGYYIHHNGIVLVAVEQSGRVLGLVAGGPPQMRSQFLRSHALRFLATAIGKSLVHRRVLQRNLEHFGSAIRGIGRRLHLVPVTTVPPAPEPPAGTWSNLLSICADPKARGRGVGQALMEAFRHESAARGYRTMRLSVHNDNLAAIRLYEKAGWAKVLTVPSGTYFMRSATEES